MEAFAMFPLGSVLFPHMPLALRVFEERYLVMMTRVLADPPPEFGVVLIESGREAAGSEPQRRFGFGTVARVTELGTADGELAVVALGDRRIEVLEWLDDDPHPAAVVRELPELEWDESLEPLREQAELVVRRTIARAAEFVDLPWDADVTLSSDPVESSWQLAGIAPLTQLDQFALLRSRSLRDLLAHLVEFTVAAGEVLTAAWPDGDALDDELAALDAEERGGSGPGPGPADGGAGGDADGPADGHEDDDAADPPQTPRA
ncbi:LON peptidase substrate-binding domain-containing protein [Agromyces aurantiacus]|uniref:LON peptidase substrate-binding domain-containing protein n=1 Tax=Agromyces aurantiacus TaxID=165814 RepID=A0ABV9R909_9MICO|nr:LON peptidase substrate-binding domain-containing protein [Agromyces aurantiacus]MBM7505347.1 Lon protease-like protein [Agromyces aurantiacus]